MRKRTVYRTVDAKGNEIDHGELPNRRNRGKLFHECQERFGHCLAALTPDDTEEKTWVFSRCIKGTDGKACSIRITSIWQEEM